ncbi:hypothetical protein BLNAU_9311 [Blattamonas nauphoetae]|uniref:Uncharacterized protein n=1 Tax=Blattamonas nauphoetae TaxID=2049346 RepID=A0ABQ9XWE7_9EUKA|nr:hypothetical protein BLNAU_9311 [Blattamonas nauphoetae]
MSGRLHSPPAQEQGGLIGLGEKPKETELNWEELCDAIVKGEIHIEYEQNQHLSNTLKGHHTSTLSSTHFARFSTHHPIHDESNFVRFSIPPRDSILKIAELVEKKTNQELTVTLGN